MKITYPQIDVDDIQAGDTVLSHWSTKDGAGHTYYEYTVGDAENLETGEQVRYYLIHRPKAVFPEEYGSVIIAKKVRGIEFPEGVALTRQRGSNYSYTSPPVMWKSLGVKISGADNHGETQIEDWVLAKVVPA